MIRNAPLLGLGDLGLGVRRVDDLHRSTTPPRHRTSTVPQNAPLLKGSEWGRCQSGAAQTSFETMRRMRQNHIYW
jgi:hypothetical protein